MVIVNEEKVKLSASVYDACDRCVICGRPVPEGVMVCPNCEEETKTHITSKNKAKDKSKNKK